jgi:quinone-modifying oxidoreductase, subunit QmoC
MGARIDPGLHREIAKFGAEDLGACMNCGNCTATCPLSTESVAFPRRIIHLLQIGHRERLAESLEPWLCYYCCECSDTCPRDANPGEIMMATRRYLTTRYDWTGLARKFYMSPAWQVGATLLVGAIVMALFAVFHGPIVTDRVALNVFAPVSVIETADRIGAAGLGILLLSNVWRMYRFVTATTPRPSLPVLLREAPTLFVHFITQKRWRGCSGNHTRWLKHLLLVSGYLTMVLLVEVGLRWFQTDQIRPFWHPTRLLGYYAAAVLLYVTGSFIVGRIRRRSAIDKFSQTSDWLFVGMLFLTALTGIMVHIFRLSGLPLTTYVTYAVHLAVAASFLIVQVPFGKWSHMLYRPVAMYLAAVQEKLQQSEVTRAAA